AAEANRTGPSRRAEYIAQVGPLAASAVAHAIEGGAVVLDTRDPEDFARGHVPGAVNIGLSDFVGPWAGTVLPAGQPVILCSDPGTERTAALELLRVAFPPPLGYLAGGCGAWSA